MGKDLTIFTKISGISNIRKKINELIREYTFENFDIKKYKFLLFADVYLGNEPFSLPAGFKGDHRFFYINNWKKARELLLASIDGKAVESKEQFERWKIAIQLGVRSALIPVEPKDIELVQGRLSVKISNLLKYFNEKSKAKSAILKHDKMKVIGKKYFSNLVLAYNPIGLTQDPYADYLCPRPYFDLKMGYEGDSYSHLDKKYLRISLPEATYELSYFQFCLLAKFFKGEIHAGDKRSTDLLEQWLKSIKKLSEVNKLISSR